MRAAFRLLVMLCLLWCAVGVAEPGQAHGGADAAHASIADVDHGDASGADADADADAGQAHHHHCPVAPDLPGTRVATEWAVPSAPPFSGHVVPLASLTRAPPLQPPSAA